MDSKRKLKTYVFFLRWVEESKFNPTREVEYGKFVKVRAFGISEAHEKLHNWAKDTEYSHAVVEKHEVLSEMESIK